VFDVGRDTNGVLGVQIASKSELGGLKTPFSHGGSHPTQSNHQAPQRNAHPKRSSRIVSRNTFPASNVHQCACARPGAVPRFGEWCRVGCGESAFSPRCNPTPVVLATHTSLGYHGGGAPRSLRPTMWFWGARGAKVRFTTFALWGIKHHPPTTNKAVTSRPMLPVHRLRYQGWLKE